MTLQDEINELKTRLAELEARAKEPEGVWEPKEDETYWYVDCSGCIESMECDGDNLDIDIVAVGNAFRTKEEAEKEANRRKVTWKLRKMAGGFVPDWNDYNCEKYGLYFDYKYKRWSETRTLSVVSINEIFFKSRQSAKNAIDTLGDELMVLL